MMFFIFTKACKKYKFNFVLNAINGLSLSLHPHDSLGFIEVKQEYYEKNYFRLFLIGIKRMRIYRNGGVYL